MSRITEISLSFNASEIIDVQAGIQLQIQTCKRLLKTKDLGHARRAVADQLASLFELAHKIGIADAFLTSKALQAAG